MQQTSKMIMKIHSPMLIVMIAMMTKRRRRRRNKVAVEREVKKIQKKVSSNKNANSSDNVTV